MKKLRVWHIPQLGTSMFRTLVHSPEQAIRILDLLSSYDSFLIEQGFKDDTASISGLEEYIDGEWIEWESVDGENIDEYINTLDQEKE